MKQFLSTLCVERPVGTAANDRINTYLQGQLCSLGYDVQALPFDCVRWESDASQLIAGSSVFDVKPSPFSEGFVGDGELVFADTVDCLKQLDCQGKILVLSGELTQTPLQPKDYPFYYPDEHKQLISTLEQKAPKAIIALTDRQPLCGLSPFPLFEDGNFKIPSAYTGSSSLTPMKENMGKSVRLSILSTNHQEKSRQLIATKCGKNKSQKIVVCAHMDSKYNTPGALDNAAGVAVLLETAKRLIPAESSVDIVPFNGEEYFGACGELAYLQHLQDRAETVSLLINIDSPCHIGADAAVSFYNFNEQNKAAAIQLFEKHPGISEGQPWYAGDHSPFVFAGTPCVAVSSGDLFDGGLANTHTPADTLNCVDTELVVPTAAYIAALIRTFE